MEEEQLDAALEAEWRRHVEENREELDAALRAACRAGFCCMIECDHG